MIQAKNGVQFIVNNIQASNCNYGTYGLYQVSDINRFEDSSSNYYNNSASDTAIYYFEAVIGKKLIGIIKNCNFQYNQGTIIMGLELIDIEI